MVKADCVGDSPALLLPGRGESEWEWQGGETVVSGGGPAFSRVTPPDSRNTLSLVYECLIFGFLSRDPLSSCNLSVFTLLFF